MVQDIILQKLENLLPGLVRFAAVLAGDVHKFNLFEQGFFEYFLKERQGVTKNHDTDLEGPDADFAAQVFAGVYDFWLWQIRQGCVRPLVMKYDESIVQPGFFPDAQNGMERQTGAFLVGLTPQQRAALLLVVGEGFSYRQVARILKVNEEHVAADTAFAKAALAGKRYTAPKGILKTHRSRQEKFQGEQLQMRLTGT